jgi:hypothetical protein
MPTFRTILIAVVFLAIGLVGGFQWGQRPGPPQSLTVELSVEGKQIKDHHAIYVSVPRGDQIVWQSDPQQLSTYSLSVRRLNTEELRKWGSPEPTTCAQAPSCPFVNECKWQLEKGKIESGRAKPGVVGCWYKFSVQGEGLTPLDPHIYFHDDKTG